MNLLQPSPRRRRAWITLAAIAATIYLAAVVAVVADDASSTGSTNAPPAVKPEAKPEAKQKQQVQKLDGAQLYAINCSRCHTERYPTEFNSAQWKTILMHMRVRANLPAKQARAILKYLQEESGN